MTRRGGRTSWRTLLTSLGLVALVAASVGLVPARADAAAGDITVFGASTSGLFPTGGVVEGPDGNLWFGNQSGHLGEVSPSGTIALHPLAGVTNVYDVTVGGDDNIWFTTTTDNKVGRYDPTTDTFDLFNAPVIFPGKITTAADGTLWVLGGGNNAARVMLNGSAGAATVNIGSAGDIMLGPDDHIWIARSNAVDELTRVHPTTGTIESFPTPQSPNSLQPRQMTIGPDDNIWFTYGDGSTFNGGVARFDEVSHVFTPFPFTTDQNPKGITTGPDGNLWYLTETNDAINRMTPTGTRTAYVTPTSPSATRFQVGPAAHEITLGPGDDLWAGGTNRIARTDGGAPVDPACLPPAFTDVSTSHPFFADICWMDQEDISTGYQPGPTYKPSAAVSRQAMSAFMYRLAGSPPFSPPAANATTFGDVPTSNTFYLEIEWMAAEDITTGTPASPKPLYKPSAAVSRGAMSAFMYRLADEPVFVPPAPNATTFGDVTATHPFFEEIEWMASEEITTGTAASPKPLYKPASVVSRAAMSAFMHRLAPLLPE